MAARSLGFLDLTEQECIDLMDEAKESWDFIVSKSVVIDSNFVRSPSGRLPITNFTGRQFLQNFGNKAREVFGDTFWIDQVLPVPSDHPARDLRAANNRIGLRNKYPGIETLCLTDMRYPNEAQRSHDLGGINVEIVRPGLGSDGHASEQPLPDGLIDYRIYNDGDLDDLADKVREFLVAIS